MTIFCGFTFFRDFDIIKLKFEELYDVVDYFVISESTKTHSGKEKPLYFLENKDLYKKYSSKIVYQTVRDTPDNFKNINYTTDDAYNRNVDSIKKHMSHITSYTPYLRDFFEKDIIYRAIKDCNDNDIIIMGDSDEIPKASVVQDLVNHFNYNEIYQLEHKMYNYYLNMRKNEPWFGNIIMSFKMFKYNPISYLRETKQGQKIENAGWHYTYTGGKDAIVKKLDAFCEQSFNSDTVKNNLEYNIHNVLNINKDLFNRNYKYWVEEITYENSPKYLVEHQGEFSEYIYSEEK